MKNLNYNYLLALLILFVSSCENDIIHQPENLNDESSSLSYSTTNPYNWTGTFHNDALDEFASEANFPYSTIEEYWDYAKLYYQRDIDGDALVGIDYEDFSSFIETYHDDNTLEQTVLMLYDDLEISLDVRDALLQLSSILTDETLYTSSSKTFNELISELQNMEQSFLTSSYAPDDEVLIYSSASVAVHSAIYWATAIDDDQNPYFIYLQDGVDTEPTAKFWRVVGVIAADVSGVLIGGLAGGLFGPAGAVAGATVVGTGASAAAM